MSDTRLAITEAHSGGVCVVSIAGRIDSSNSPDLATRMNGLFSSGERAILLDFADVRFLSSAAFHVLLVAATDAKRTGARLAICNMAPQVHELFEVCGLLDSFTIVGSRETGLAELG
jgi:anti-anti-sigma factor